MAGDVFISNGHLVDHQGVEIDLDIDVTPGGSPSGPAGGDLAGTYPNPVLGTSGATPGTYGSTTQVPVLVVDAKGRITGISVVTVESGGGAPTGAAGGVLAGTYPDPTFAEDMATQAELDAHTSDTTDAHDASSISVVDGADHFSGTDVETVLHELQLHLEGHATDPVQAHDATAIWFQPTGTISATTVQAAITEAYTDATAYTDMVLAANDAMIYRGVIDCSSNPNYPAAVVGDTYRVSVAGKIGGASGITVDAGDLVICNNDAAAGNQAAVGTSWNIIQSNVVGAYYVGGPDVAVADGGTGGSSVGEALTNLQTLRQTAISRMISATGHPALYSLQRAFATRTTAPIKMAFIGDSLFAFSLAHRPFVKDLHDVLSAPNRAMNVTLDWAASGTILPGDETWGVSGALNVFTAISGSLTLADVVANRGRSGSAIALANGETFTTPSMSCTSLYVRWLTPLSGAGATLTLAIDGVTVATPSSAAAGGYEITGLSALTNHTLTVTSNGVNLFDCIDIAIGNESSGFRPYTIANTGETIGSFNAYTDFDEGIAYLNPDCVVIEPFTNYANGTSQTMYSDLATLVDTIRANCTASIVFAIPQASMGDTEWALFVGYARKLAKVKNCYVIEIGDSMPDLSQGTSIPWSRSGTTVTVPMTQHYLRVGDAVGISSSTQTTPLPNGTYTVVTATNDSFTITGVNSGATNGFATVQRRAYTSDGVHYDATIGRYSFSNGLYRGLFQGVRPVNLRDEMSPSEITMGRDRDERRYHTHFNEFSLTVPLADSAKKVPGTPYSFVLAGAATQVSQIETAEIREGVAKLETGTSAGGLAFATLGARGFTFSLTARQEFGVMLKVPVLSTLAQAFNLQAGFWDTSTLAVGGSGIYFRPPLTAGIFGNWECVCRHAGVETAVDSGVAVSTGYRNLIFKYDPLTGFVNFYIQSALVAQINTNLPDGDTMTAPSAGIYASAGTTTKLLYLDAMSAIIPDIVAMSPIWP